MGLGSGGLQGKAGVELHVIFGQWVWIHFAESSSLHMGHEPPGAVFLSIYYLGHSTRYVYRLRFHNQTDTHDWTLELQTVHNLRTLHDQRAQWLQCLFSSTATNPKT